MKLEKSACVVEGHTLKVIPKDARARHGHRGRQRHQARQPDARLPRRRGARPQLPHDDHLGVGPEERRPGADLQAEVTDPSQPLRPARDRGAQAIPKGHGTYRNSDGRKALVGQKSSPKGLGASFLGGIISTIAALRRLGASAILPGAAGNPYVSSTDMFVGGLFVRASNWLDC